MYGIADENIMFLVCEPGHKDRVTLLDLANNSEEHDGKMIVIKNIVGEPIYPFVEKRFYFNDKGDWYTLEELNNV